VVVNDWPGRTRAEASRQWPALQALARSVASIDGIDGLILLGSFANGEHDELSDSDRDLAEPYVVLVGEQAVADRFPRISSAQLDARRREQADQPLPGNPNDLPYGELIDWKLAELKHAVGRGLRRGGPSSS
jgi:hypothetical protein